MFLPRLLANHLHRAPDLYRKQHSLTIELGHLLRKIFDFPVMHAMGAAVEHAARYLTLGCSILAEVAQLRGNGNPLVLPRVIVDLPRLIFGELDTELAGRKVFFQLA